MAAPANAAEAVEMFLDGLGFVAAMDPTALAAEAQAQCLQALEHGDALHADGMKAGSVLLTGGFAAAGAVRLLGAEITSQLNCSGAQLTGTDSDGNTLVADGMKVGEDVFLDGGFTAAGTVSLNSTHVPAFRRCEPGIVPVSVLWPA